MSSSSSSISLYGMHVHFVSLTSTAAMAAEAFIWQGNRISSTELPPATTHTRTHTLSLADALTEEGK